MTYSSGGEAGFPGTSKHSSSTPMSSRNSSGQIAGIKSILNSWGSRSPRGMIVLTCGGLSLSSSESPSSRCSSTQSAGSAAIPELVEGVKAGSTGSAGSAAILELVTSDSLNPSPSCSSDSPSPSSAVFQSSSSDSINSSSSDSINSSSSDSINSSSSDSINSSSSSSSYSLSSSSSITSSS